MAIRALFLVFIFIPAFCTFAEVQLKTAVLEDSRKILITFDHDNSEEMIEKNCHFNLFSADKKRDLKTLPGKGLSIATFYKAQSSVSIVAVDLRKLSRKKFRKKNQNLFLRVLIPCETGETTMSEVTQVRVPTFRRGKVKNIDRLIKRMKYHMRYATEEEIASVP